MQKKIGIFYVNAGGGHSGTAKALAREIEEKYSDVAEPILVDAMQGDPSLARWFLERGYALAINNFPYNWRIIYWFSKLKSVMRGEDKFFARAVRKNVAEIIAQEKFEVIIVVHYFITSSVLEILEEQSVLGGKAHVSVPVYSVVTDPFSAPPLWFLNKDIKYFVFSEMAEKLAIENGVVGKNIVVVPPVINSKFLQARELNKKDVRKKLNFPLDKKIILVAAGGDGLYRGRKIVKSLVKLPEGFRVVVVCGREQKFLNEVEILQKKYPQKILAVCSFVENMEELMAAADLVISKAGPATIFEALAVGRPLMLVYYLEQEKGNCDFVVDNKLGKYEPRISELPKTIVDFFSDEGGYKNTIKRINALSLRTGVGDIAQKILGI